VNTGMYDKLQSDECRLMSVTTIIAGIDTFDV